jgi:hypothetical protein
MKDQTVCVKSRQPAGLSTNCASELKWHHKKAGRTMRLLNRGDLQKLTHLVARTGNVREVRRNESTGKANPHHQATGAFRQ